MERFKKSPADRGPATVRCLLSLLTLVLATPGLSRAADPSVSFSPPSPGPILDTNPGTNVFSRINISHPDDTKRVMVSIEFPSANGSFPVTPGVFTNYLDGSDVVYVLVPDFPSNSVTYLKAIPFTPTIHRIPIGETETTSFLVTAVDVDDNSDSASVTLSVSPVNDAPVFSVSLAGTATEPIPDNLPTNLLANIVVEDVDAGRFLGVVGPQRVQATVSLSESAFAVGSFPGHTDVYTVTDTPANVTTQLRQLTFTPQANRLPVGTQESFNVNVVIRDVDGLDAANNGLKASYVISINDPPTLSSSLSPTTTDDVTTIRPFRATVSDPDPNDQLSLSITPIQSTYGSIGPAGPYVGSKAQIESTILNISFSPVRNSVSTSQSLTFNFGLADSHGASVSSSATLTITGINDTPDITGVSTSPVRTTDDPAQPPVHPFASVRIFDADDGGLQTQTVTLTPNNPAYGSLSTTMLQGTPDVVTALIRAVTYVPALRPDRILGEVVTDTLTIHVRDSGGLQRNNSVTTVAITSVNGAPQILGVPPASIQPVRIPPTPPLLPFAGLSITDDDGTNLVVTVTIDDPAKGSLTNLGVFVSAGSGVYVTTNLPNTVTMSLTNLHYDLNPSFLFPPNEPGGTEFTIEAVDFVLNRTEATLAILVENEPLNHFVTRTTDDRNPGSLRHALENAGNNGVVTLALETYPRIIRLDFSLGPILILSNITLRGPGPDLLTISGDKEGDLRPDTQLFRVFANFIVEGVTLADGSARGATTTGGAIYVGRGGQLTLRQCVLRDSVAAQWGGAIDVEEGGLRLEQCLVADNRIDPTRGLGGGAISLYTIEPCAFINTTFSGNRQDSLTGIGGGAIYAEAFDPTWLLDVEVIHCTFADNEDASLNASALLANVFGTVVTVRNSIFNDGQFRNLDVTGSALLRSDGGNLSDDSTRTILTQGGQPKDVILLDQMSDRTQVNPGLSDLDPTLRPMAGYPLEPGSPAIGMAVNPSPPAAAIDQRGVLRTNRLDAGALEFEATERVVLNEIHFDPDPAIATDADFVEFYVTRDSAPVSLNGYTLLVDGTNRHTFASTEIVQPGNGVIVADSAISIVPTTNAPTPVRVALSGPLHLGARGRVELRKPDGGTVLDVNYVGAFASLSAPTQVVAYAHNSISLAPQFRGSAYVPNSVVLAPPLGGADLLRSSTNNTSSPGADALGTPFGLPNDFPSARPDTLLLSEDLDAIIPVLDNDLDGDGTDRLVVVDVSRSSDPGSGDVAQTNSWHGAQVSIQPGTAPLRGLHVHYDPRSTNSLQSLAEGARTNDTFFYEIIDIGAGPILEYRGVLNTSPLTIYSPGHRLTNSDIILISGSSIIDYNGERTVTYIDDDTFSVSTNYLGDASVRGSWQTKDPRHPTRRSEAIVTVTLLGANDPPQPQEDGTTTDEETIIRIMADAALAGSNIVFATDALYPARPLNVTTNLLANDRDPDTDDNAATLRVIGVVGEALAIQGYSSTNGGASVRVLAPGHQLENGTVVLIAGYGGHASYNGFHAIAVDSPDTFVIPVLYVDNHPARGLWTVLNDENRLSALSHDQAAVQLEIRADRRETSLVYNPRVSSTLNALTVGETNMDYFYYAAEDRHGAVGLAKVTVRVAGVNDAPNPQNDPISVANLISLVTESNTLAQVLAALQPVYHVPPASGLPDRADLQARSSTNEGALNLFLTDLWTTDEDHVVHLSTADLLSNDGDVDLSDQPILEVIQVTASRESATVTLNTTVNPPVVTYDPRNAPSLNSLAREEPLLDTFEITVSDGHTGGSVTSLVAVLVVGANDQPVAQGDQTDTKEDQIRVLGPETDSVLANDVDADINLVAPDNRLRLVPMTNIPTPGDARVTTLDQTLTYDPTGSAFLDGLAFGQSYTDRFDYVTMDGSFLFANDDHYRVELDGADFVLNVLDNDRNWTGVGHPIEDFAGAAGEAPLTVRATGHGLSDGMIIAITGYQGAGLYNDVHAVTVVDENIFTIPAEFLDNAAGKGQWSRLTITSVTEPNRGGTVSIDSAGSRILYTPEVNFVGDEVFRYQITDEMGGTDTALVNLRVTVNQLNGNLQANPDRFLVALGEEVFLDVLANDNILPEAGSDLVITRIFDRSGLGQSALENNLVRFVQAPGGPTPSTNTFRYEISGGGSALAVAQVVVIVSNRVDTLPIREDAFAVQSGSGNNVLDVLANDAILPGSNADLTLDAILDLPDHGAVALNETRTALLYTPNPGFVGQDTLVYRAADGLGGTGSALVKIDVGSLTTATDFFTVPYSTSTNDPPVLLDVLANDGVVQGVAGTNVTLTMVTPESSPVGVITLTSDERQLQLQVATNVFGEQQFVYTITDGFGRTAEGTVTVVILQQGIVANSDAFTVAADSSVNVLDVLTNDVVFPNFGQEITIVSVGTGLDGPIHGGLAQVNAEGDRLIYTPAPGFLGEETFTYTMTDATSTDTAKVVVRVTAGALSANDDALTVFYEAPPIEGMPRQFVLPVLANDRVIPNLGQLLTITGVGIDDGVETNAPNQQGSVEISADGSTLLYVPSDAPGFFPFVERFTYEISDGTQRRAQAIVRVTVLERTNARDLETSDDAFSVQANSLNNALSVLANDAVQPATAAGWTISGFSAASHGGAVAINGSQILYSPQPEFVGTDVFTYSVSDGLGGSGSATVRVKVGDRSLSEDVFSVVSASANNVLNVLANDGIRPETAEDFTLLSARTTNSSATASVAGGRVLFTPDPNWPGEYPHLEQLSYVVEDDSGLTATSRVDVTVYERDSDRAQATLLIRVDGVNDAPTITGTAPADPITDKETVLLFPGVTIGDVDDQGQQELTVTVTLDQARGLLVSLGGFVQVGPGVYTFTGTPADATTALQGLVYDPIENRITVPTTETTTFSISVDDHFVTEPVTDNATIVSVTAVNDPPIISGTVPDQTVYQYWTIKPFAGVTVTEVDDLTLQPLRVTVTLDDPTHGFLTALGGFVDAGNGVYTLGTPAVGVTAASASAVLRTLVFVPTTGGRVTPEAPEVTRFEIKVEDGFAAPVLDDVTTVVALHEFAAKLRAADGATGDNLGAAVDASRDMVVVGAPLDDDQGNGSGSAYVFAYDATQTLPWQQAKKLLPVGGAAGDQFGGAVSISGNLIAVSAPFNRDVVASGSVYLFERASAAPNSWVQIKKIVPADGAANDEFGYSVSLDGDNVLIGSRADDDNGSASGSAYLYSRNQNGINNWGLVKKLLAGDAAAGDEFGYSVSIDGTNLVVGARFNTHSGGRIGAAYVFSRDHVPANPWAQLKKLIPLDGMPSDEFGFSVGMSDGHIVVGARAHDHLGNDTGAAYVFAHVAQNTNDWTRIAELLQASVLNNDQFGHSVSISGDQLVAGMPFSGIDNQSKYGSAFVYGQDMGGLDQWGVVQLLERTDPENNDQFGTAVSIGQNTAAIGVRMDDDLGGDSGSVYLYRLKFNNPPLLVSEIPDQLGATNAPFSYTVPADTFADADVKDDLTLTATLDDGSPLPSWLTFSSDTRTFSGNPTQAASYVIRLVATDEDGASVADLFQISVSAIPLNLVRVQSVNLSIERDAMNGQVLLAYERLAGSADASYTLEFALDLLRWRSGEAMIITRTLVPIGSVYERVILRLPAPPSGSAPIFFRMRATE